MSVIATAHATRDERFFGHPRGLATLFLTEMWERFSYYGMRALLILFMTAEVSSGGLGFDVAKAGAIYGTYTALVYLGCLPGGWVADRFLGQRNATFYGGVVILCGHVSLAVPTLGTFYLGLALIIIGTGLLKPNISTMVGQLYATDDARRDAGFSIYYMGINLGAFFAPLVCGWLGQSTQFRAILPMLGIAPERAWHFGFAAAAFGMAAGLLAYATGARHLGDIGRLHGSVATPRARADARRQLARGVLVVFALVATLLVLHATGTVHLTVERIGDAFGVALLIVTLAFFGWMFTLAQWSPSERRQLVVLVVLFFGAAVFWSLFEQGGSTLNLFAERNTDTRLLGFDFPASWLQSLNALFIIVLAPVFAWLWVRLGKRNPSSPAKFTLGLVFVALGFAVLIVASRAAASGVAVSPAWLAVTYLLHTIGELCLSPVGLSAMTRLAPARIAGLAMGVWFLATSIGSYLGGRVASLYESFSLVQIFSVVTVFALVAAMLMAASIRPIRRMLEGR